jgi:hypothetical protein
MFVQAGEAMPGALATRARATATDMGSPDMDPDTSAMVTVLPRDVLFSAAVSLIEFTCASNMDSYRIMSSCEIPVSLSLSAIS